MKTLKLKIFPIILFTLLISCGKSEQADTKPTGTKKIGVLLVSHGSHSAKWREMLSAIEDSVETEVMNNKKIIALRSAFMEYNEPSIATRLKEFDKEGYTDVIIIPVLLTVSGHSFDDIPHIAGLKESKAEIEKLKTERIEVYKAKAKVTITQLLDYPKILGDNIVNRVKALSANPAEEGCVLVAYGDRQYNEEWTKLMGELAGEIKSKMGIDKTEFSWCGHIVDYDTKPTTDAIESVLKEKKKALVIPVLVAFDEMFQGKIIGGAIDHVKNKKRVVYKPDAILPDENIEKWVIDIAHKTANQIAEKNIGEK